MFLEIEGGQSIIADFGDAPKSVTAAMVRALNRSIGSGRTFMGRAISQDTGLSVTAVRKSFRVEEATFQRPQATLGAGLRRIPLSEFRAKGQQPSRGRGMGVSYSVDGTRRRIAEAFLTTLSSGHTGVFKRVGESARMSRGAWSKNLPIKELFGPSIGRVFAKYRPAGLERVREQFLKNFGHELRFRDSGGGFNFEGGADAGTD